MKLYFLLLLTAAAEAHLYNGFLDWFKPNVTAEDLTFTLYNRKNGNAGVEIFLGDKESIQKSGFDPLLPVKIVTHGFLNNGRGSSVEKIRKAFENQPDCNFIALDWSKYSKNLLYEEAAEAVKGVGIVTSKFLKFLRDETKFDLGNVHAIGHSLGAHVVSFISNEFPNEKIGRITGTDPAGPLLELLPPTERLDPSDAHFVDVIHTNINFYGMRTPAGSADFYVNGGGEQPSCGQFNMRCNHNMAVDYLAHTIKTGISYESIKCKNVREAENQQCDGERAPMGYGVDKLKRGIFHAKIMEAPINV